MHHNIIVPVVQVGMKHEHDKLIFQIYKIMTGKEIDKLGDAIERALCTKKIEQVVKQFHLIKWENAFRPTYLVPRVCWSVEFYDGKWELFY